MCMIINTGWIPGYLQHCGEMLREHYKNKRKQTLSETEYFNRVMKYVDMHPNRDEILSDLKVDAHILAECYEEGHQPEYCYAQLLKLYF